MRLNDPSLKAADTGSVTDRIRAAIANGEYAPLQRLIEADLSQTFGASRATVRAALQELASEGLVEIQRNRGARVRAVSLAEAIEITEVRMVLEGLIAAKAAERVTRQQAQELRSIGTAMRKAVATSQLLNYSDLNARLHHTIREIGDHPTATGIINRLHAQSVRFQFRLALQPGRPAVSLPQHERIIKAIAARDPAAAEAAMREHLASVVAALQASA